MPRKVTSNNLQRSTLEKVSKYNPNPLIPLRIEYSLYSKLLSNYINKLVGVSRIYPGFLPTQASGRWSTINPPITNWPRQCINPFCPSDEHEWTEECWSIRDILSCDEDEVLITWDHDNIEGKIHDLIVLDQTAIQAHKDNLDLHTITCCNIFNMELPRNLVNPHSSVEDAKWREKYKWQGKDTKQRVLSKNFNHGSKYSPTWRFVYEIKGIEKYGVDYKQLGALAKRYIKQKEEPWNRKLEIMEDIRRAKIARTLYGFRRKFFDSSVDTGKEGFSHMISGTVTDYNNETLNTFEELLGDSFKILHNAHDGDKIAIKKDNVPSKEELKRIIERPISYNGNTLTLTAGIKVYEK